MNYMNWFLPLVALVIIYIITNNYSNKLTPEIYVTNTYLYVLLAIVIVASSWSILDETPNIVSEIFNSGFNLVALFVLSLTSMFFVIFTSPKNFTQKHLAWFTFVLSLGVMSYVTYSESIDRGTFGNVFVCLVVLVSILTWLAYNKPFNYFDSWQNPLLTILFGLVLVESGDLLLFHKNTESFLTRTRVYSWIAIVLFSGFLLNDTQKIRKNAITHIETCKEKEQFCCVDYPNESLSLFLDILNLFSNMVNVSGK